MEILLPSFYAYHQDISPQDIKACIKNSFEKYVDNFNLSYDQISRKLTIYEEKVIIGTTKEETRDTNGQNLEEELESMEQH